MTDTIPPDLLHACFTHGPEMLFIAREDGRVMHWSGALARALGASIEGEGEGERQLAALIHPDDRTGFSAAWARLRRGQESVEFEARILDREAAYRSFTVSACRAPGADTVHGSLRPAANQASPTLKERFLDAITENLNLAIWAYDTEGILTHYEGRGLIDFGMEPGELVGQSVYKAFDRTEEELKQACAGASHHEISQERGIWLETWMIPVRASSGAVEVVLGISLNISQAKQVEQELRTRLAQIENQQDVIRSLSTPIIEVWDGVLTLPMVGVVDSVRTAEVMDALLARVVEKQARFAILDLTGVDMVDTKVANHLIELVTAIRLLGAEGIVAGIKPTVAQTMVALGLDLTQIVTHRDLRASLAHCIRRMNLNTSNSTVPAQKSRAR